VRFSYFDCESFLTISTTISYRQELSAVSVPLHPSVITNIQSSDFTARFSFRKFDAVHQSAFVDLKFPFLFQHPSTNSQVNYGQQF